DRLPISGRQDERHDVQLPGPGMAAAVVIDVVSDAIVLDGGAGRLLAAVEFFRRKLGEGLGKSAPVRPKLAVAVTQFVKTGSGFRDFRHLATHTPLRRSKA